MWPESRGFLWPNCHSPTKPNMRMGKMPPYTNKSYEKAVAELYQAQLKLCIIKSKLGAKYLSKIFLGLMLPQLKFEFGQWQNKLSQIYFGCAAYAPCFAPYAVGWAPYAVGFAACAVGCMAYAVGCATYVRHIERKKLTHSSWTEAGTELGNMDLG